MRLKHIAWLVILLLAPIYTNAQTTGSADKVTEQKEPFRLFIGGTVSRGTYTYKTGDPAHPFSDKDIQSFAVLLDARGKDWFLTFNLSKTREDAAKFTHGGQLRGQILSIGPIELGFGLRYNLLPKHVFYPPTIAYVNISTQEYSGIGLALLDVGVGKYNHTYIRALGAYGLGSVVSDTAVSMFDRPKIIERSWLSRSPEKFYGFGAEAQLSPMRNMYLFVSGLQLNSQNTQQQIFPTSHTIFEERATYITPIHIGISLRATQATKSHGMDFFNVSYGAYIGVAF